MVSSTVMLNKAGIGDLDYVNITALTRGCKFWRSGTISTLCHHFLIHLRQGQEWLKITRQKISMLEERQVNGGTTIRDSRHHADAAPRSPSKRRCSRSSRPGS